MSAIYLLTTVLLLFGIVMFAARRARYSHIRHTISELGEVGAMDERRIGYGLFLPVGVVLIVSAVVTWLSLTNDEIGYQSGLAASIGIGYLIAALFPCDAGSPLQGTTRQQIHNLGGFIEYVGGAYCLIQLGSNETSSVNLVLEWLGYVTLAGAILLSVHPLFRWRGLIQRITELCLFGGLIISHLP